MNSETWRDPDPMLPRSRHQSLKILLRMPAPVRPPRRSWLQSLIRFLEALFS